MTDTKEPHDNSDHENIETNEIKETRTRTLTEKGREYNASLAIEARKTLYKKWRRQLNRLSALLVDSEDVTLLRTERNELETLFNELTARQERLEECLENNEGKKRAEEEYDCWDRDNVEAFKAVNSRIADLLSIEIESQSCRSVSTSRSARSSLSKKIVKGENEQHPDVQSQKETIAQKQMENERLKLIKKLVKTQTKLKALELVKKENDSSASFNCRGENDLLENYLESQLVSATSSQSDEEKSCASSRSSLSDLDEPSVTAEGAEKSPEITPCTSSGSEAISRLADLLSQRQQRDHLPRPEPESFDGNLLRFPLWIKSFETLIESRTTIPSERLYYLGRYTKGEAREVIEGVLPLTTEDAYQKAKTQLRERFGNPFLISDAYRKKINEWPRISASDGPSLRKFADFLETCRAATTEIKYLKVLDDPDENQRMLQKLPSFVVTRWSRVVDRWLSKEDHAYPPFTEFCGFLKKL